MGKKLKRKKDFNGNLAFKWEFINTEKNKKFILF